MTALEILKRVRSEMRPNAKTGEYELPVILKAMHDFAALRQPPVSGSVCQCKVNRMVIRHEDKDWCNSCGELVKAN